MFIISWQQNLITDRSKKGGFKLTLYREKRRVNASFNQRIRPNFYGVNEIKHIFCIVTFLKS